MKRWSAIALVAVLLSAGCAAGPPKKIPLGLAADDLKQVADSRPALAAWRVRLGPVLVESITPLADGALLVATVDDAPRLTPRELIVIEPDTGTVRWRAVRETGAAALLGQTENELVFVHRGEDGVFLSSRRVADGKQLWRDQAQAERQTLFHAGTGRLVSTVAADDQIHVRSLAPSGGTIWEQGIADGQKVSRLLPLGDQVGGFAGGLYLFSSEGKKSGVIDLQPLPEGVAPRVAAEKVFTPDGSRCLAAVDLPEGRLGWRSCLPAGHKVTSLQPAGPFLFVASSIEKLHHAISMFDVENGKRLWSVELEDALASNLLVQDDRIFAATTRDLLVLDAGNGAVLKRDRLMVRGSRFPARLVKTSRGIAYIGEFLVVGMDEQGNRLYRQGITPISVEASLAGFDAVIRRLKGERAFWAGLDISQNQFLSEYHNTERIRFQNLAASSMSSRELGPGFSAPLNRGIANTRMNQAFAAQESVLSAFHAGLAAMEAWYRAMKLAEYRTRIERRIFMRRALLAAYRQASEGKYVWRPVSASLHYVAAAIIDLESGKRADTVLSPAYQGYGLWSVLDASRGLVYHQGVGMEPGHYRWSEPHKMADGLVRTLETYLVAQPVRLPR